MTDGKPSVYVTVSALDAGHITLPERLFVTNADPEKRTTVPSLSFLIQHSSPTGKITKLVFDLGVKRDLENYRPAQQEHIANRQPLIVDPDCASSLRAGGIDLENDIDYIMLSHVHWDHVGTPSDFPNSTFLVGSGTLALLKNGGGPLYPAEMFNHDELPLSRTVELPSVPKNNSTSFSDTASVYYSSPHAPKHTPMPSTSQAHLPPSAEKNWTWRPLTEFNLPNTLDLFGDGSLLVVDSPGHLYGHVNLLARLGEKEYVYLGGDCCHDPRILAGEKGIAMYEDGRGGLGVMGYPMAKNLRAGLTPNKTLLVCDINTEALDRFKAETNGKGPVEIINNGFEAAKVANTVITMLPTSSSVKEVYLDPETGILAGAAVSSPSSSTPEQPKLLLECGTIDSSTIQLVHKTLESMKSTDPSLSNTFFVDAPVSGGPMGAQSASLTFMVGCPPDSSTSIFPLIKSYLSAMGPPSSIFPCGPCGSGAAFKIINNYLSAITSLAASEALNIGVKAGLDPKLLTEVINASGGQCWVTSRSNPVPGVQENVPSSRDYEGGFRIELCAKVLGMGSDLARVVGARTVLDGPTLGAFAEAMGDERYKGKDARVVYRWLSESGNGAGAGDGEGEE
ncbi:hypothetical protein V8F33_004520 [Rhypophila sp. PSN 637]